MKKHPVAAWIMIALGAFELVALLADVVFYDLFTVQKALVAVVSAALYILYGVLLMKKEIKGYGWGIGVVVSLSMLVFFVPDSNAIKYAILAVVFGFFFVRANIKKSEPVKMDNSQQSSNQ